MLEADVLEIGAPTLVECMIVVGRADGEDGIDGLSDFLRRVGIVIVPFDEPHTEVASQAFLGFGKGRHPAGLNYGDCMTYATARMRIGPCSTSATTSRKPTFSLHRVINQNCVGGR